MKNKRDYMKEVGARIKAVRDGRGESQRQFALNMGVKNQATVSAWEKGLRAPSNDILLRVFNLAHYPDNLWFLQQAGATASAIRFFAEKHAPKHNDDGVFRAERVTETPRGMEAAGPPLPIPVERVTSDKTVCLVRGGVLAVVDKSETELHSLWGESVLVEFDSGQRPRPSYEGFMEPEGYFWGRLQREFAADKDGFWWTAQLHSENDRPYLTDVQIAAQRYPYPLGVKLIKLIKGVDWLDFQQELRLQKMSLERMKSHLKLKKSCRIVGRVVAWFPATAKKG